MESKSVLNNMYSVKSLLDKLETKKKSIIKDSTQLKEMFKVAKRNLNKSKSKRENVQQRFTVEKLENTKQEIMYFSIDVDDEYNNLLSHTFNLMNLIDKQCQNINEHIEFIKKYCEFN
jgi:DNA repair ATPase RecN